MKDYLITIEPISVEADSVEQAKERALEYLISKDFYIFYSEVKEVREEV